jgi:enoyl-CoA hydratase
MSDGVEVTCNGGIAEVVIDRPPVNALARDTYSRISEVFDSFADAYDVRVVILTGAGTRAFCAGRDIKDLQVERSDEQLARVADPYHATREAFWSVRHCAVPVICAVNGPAVGAGVALVAVSDVAIAAESATFALTEIDVGVLGAASFAQWLVGPGKARRMFFTGERVPAEEIYRLGGLDKVVPLGELMTEARALASVIAGKSPVAIRIAKASVVRADSLPLEAAYQTEQDYTRHLSAYEASSEAIRGFGANQDRSV